MVIMQLCDGPKGERWQDMVQHLHDHLELNLLDQHGSVVVLLPKRFCPA